MGFRKDLAGKVFGDLTVVCFSHSSKNYNSYWLCKCVCGAEKTVRGGHLTSGKSTSCHINTYYAENNYMVCRKHDGIKILFDSRDYDRIKKYAWCVNADGYVVAHNAKKVIYLHDLIMRPCEHETVDHIEHNKLDNRREKLRLCSIQQNTFNKRKTRGFSAFKGVSWHKVRRDWRAYIVLNRKQIHLGYFKIEQDAAKAYNAKAVELFGEYAKLNNI